MKKLALNVEELRVSGFEVEPRAVSGEGTVVGHEKYVGAVESYFTIISYTYPAHICAMIPPTRSCFC